MSKLHFSLWLGGLVAVLSANGCFGRERTYSNDEGDFERDSAGGTRNSGGASGGSEASRDSKASGGSKASRDSSASGGSEASRDSTASGGTETRASIGSSQSTNNESIGGRAATDGDSSNGGVTAVEGDNSTLENSAGGVSSESSSSTTGNSMGGTAAIAMSSSGGTSLGNGVPPTVLRVLPAPNALNVTTSPVVITFSEAMNTASVESALRVAIRGVQSVTWNASNTEVKLQVAYTYASTVKTISYIIPTSVVDAGGESLAAQYKTSFQLSRVVEQELYVDLGMSGHRGTNCSGGATTGTWVYGGDSSSNCIYRTGYSFETVGKLPVYSSVKGLASARFRGQLCGVTGNPAALAPYILEHVTYSSVSEIGAATVIKQLANLVEPGGTMQSGGFLEQDVTAAVESVWKSADATAPGKYVQLRVRPKASNGDGVADRYSMRRTEDAAENTCPAADSDVANRMRIIVQYFP